MGYKCDYEYSIALTPETSGKHGINHVPVGCGKCYNCKLKRISQWSFRLQQELQVSTSAYFITLTYDTHNVPIIQGRYPMTLVKNSEQNELLKDSEGRTDRSLQAFFKRLRYYEEGKSVQFDKRTKHFKEKRPIKYYACGEYGGKRSRPHYHIILFNVVDVQNVIKSWEFGQVHIDPDVNKSNIEYTLKYICKSGKKIGSGQDDYRIPEFPLMSKGLGKNWITPEIESFYNRRLDISYVVNELGIKIPLPRYYANKMFNENTKEDRHIVIKRQVEEKEKKDRKTEQQKVNEKVVRQQLMKNYSPRNID